MNKLNKFFCIMIFLFMLFSGAYLLLPATMVIADDGDSTENYVIYDENDEFISEKSAIEEGDTFVTKDFYEYEIYKIEGKKGYARVIGRLKIPKIKRGNLQNADISPFTEQISTKKKLCLYMTHNDESYVPTDGYDSIYGAGGIHDVAKVFQLQLKNRGINVILDETLHIPHNSSAYTRSSVTASNLLTTENPDAMFDIHRDGVSKSYYYTSQNGQDLSKVRIVVGKSNPNFSENYEFAQYVFAIGNSMYPWLFSDIYCGSGHYNQKFQSTDLLFEMGTYLIEKDYVYNTMPYLADVVNTALYASLEDDKGDITVDNNAPSTNESPVVENDDYIVVEDESKNNIGAVIGWTIFAIVVIGGVGGVTYYFIKLEQKNAKNQENSNKNTKKSKK